MNNLDFEKPIIELEAKISELHHTAVGATDLSDEIEKLQGKVDKLVRQTYAKLTAAQKVQVARHPNRPHFMDYINHCVEDFTALAGDRAFGEDEALIGGMGRINGHSVMILGQERGNDTDSRIRHNFGMPRPEGYRKAIRLMQMADRFKLPIVTLIDTAGAYPGIASEERGQAEAIAKSIEACLRVSVPVIAIVIGEGGSGGAVAIGVADTVAMLEHAIYSVISPEGCASILWRSASHAQDAANALKITAQDLKTLGVIDTILPEPYGGAHRKPVETMDSVRDFIVSELEKYRSENPERLRTLRREKFLAMGLEQHAA